MEPISKNSLGTKKTRKLVKKLNRRVKQTQESDKSNNNPPLLFNQPLNFMPVIHVLQDHLPWRTLRALQLTSKSWAIAVRNSFYQNSEFYIEIQTPLKRSLVNRDHLDNSPYFRAYRYPMEELRRKTGEKVNLLESVFPLVPSEEIQLCSSSPGITSLTIRATILDECEEMDRLLIWLKAFGTKVTRLTLYKPILHVIHEPNLGSTNMIVRKKTFHKLLECFPSLKSLEVTGSRLNIGSLESFMLTTVEDDELFEDVEELFRNTQGSGNSDEGELEHSKTFPNIRKLKIRELFKSEGTEEIIAAFPMLERLTLKFLEFAEAFDKLHALRNRSLLKNIRELELVCKDSENFFDRHSVYELAMMDFNCLETFRIDRISVESDMNDTGVLYLIRFLEKVKGTLTKLEINCVNVHWYMGRRGRRFIEILSESIPTMEKLRSLRIHTVSEETPQPLLQVVRRLPVLEKLSFTHKFEMMDQYHLNFLPDELFVCESMRSFKLKSIDFVLDNEFFKRLHLFFPNLEVLDVLIDCGDGTSLFSFFKQITKWPELTRLRLRCNTIEEKDFNMAMSFLLYVGLTSLIIENLSQSRIRLNVNALKRGFQVIPYLELLEFKGFEDLRKQEKEDLYKTLGARNVRLNLIL